MIINSKIKNTSDAIDYLNRAVFGDDPETSVLTRVYEGDTPIQDRVTAVENSAALVDVQALKDKVDELSNLTEIFANLATPMPNLVSNSDLSIAKPSPNQNEPLGFTYGNATDITLVGGIAKFTPSAISGRIETLLPNLVSQKVYCFTSTKTTSNTFALRISGGQNTLIAPSNFSLTSAIFTPPLSSTNLQIIDEIKNTGFLPIEVDYMGAFNVSQMMLKGVKDDNGTPFTLLTDTQIKTQLDLWMQTRFPLDVLLMMRS